MDEFSEPAAEERPTLRGPLALCLLLAAAGSIKPLMRLPTAYGDNDDAMRLLQARDLLNGQSWWDLVQHRMAPPDGLPMHWSRLLDGPIASLLFISQHLFGPQAGELITRAIWPVALFVPTAWAVLAITRRLGSRTAVWIAAALLPLCWFVWILFAPGRIDHHNAQIALVACMLLAALDARRIRAAAIMGVLAGVSVAIGFETIAAVGWSAAFIAYFYVTDRARARATAAYGLALAGTVLAAFLIQTPPAWWMIARCDALALNTMVGCVAGGLGLAALAKLPIRSMPGRLIAAALAGGATLALTLALHPSCIGGPYADIDPRIVPLWLNQVEEAAPLGSWWRTAPITCFSVAAVPFAALAMGAWALARDQRMQQNWIVMSLLAVTMLVAVSQARGFAIATVVAAPILAAQLARVRYVRTAKPMAAGLALGLLIGPSTTFNVLKWSLPPAASAHEKLSEAHAQDCLSNAALADIKKLPPSLILADLDTGPHILANTNHRVVAGPYHRLGQAIYDGVTVFGGSPEAAAAIINRDGANVVALCRTGVFARQRTPGSFASTLLDGGPAPAWLTPLRSSRGEYALFRVQRNLLAANDGLKGREDETPAS